MYGNGYSMAIVLDHRSTATSLTGNQGASHLTSQTRLKFFSHMKVMYLSVLIGILNDAKRHLLSIFVQIQLTVTNRTFMDVKNCCEIVILIL